MLDFRLSHGSERSRRKFDKQLKKFLLLRAEGRYHNGKARLNATLESHRIMLLYALRDGAKVCSPRDIEAYFPQRYIINAFYEYEDEIYWDVECDVDEVTTLDVQEMFYRLSI